MTRYTFSIKTKWKIITPTNPVSSWTFNQFHNAYYAIQIIQCHLAVIWSINKWRIKLQPDKWKWFECKMHNVFLSYKTVSDVTKTEPKFAFWIMKMVYFGCVYNAWLNLKTFSIYKQTGGEREREIECNLVNNNNSIDEILPLVAHLWC